METQNITKSKWSEVPEGWNGHNYKIEEEKY